nr:MAG TPA: hypothetical protein [Caudoviricetes sp.]
MQFNICMSTVDRLIQASQELTSKAEKEAIQKTT